MLTIIFLAAFVLASIFIPRFRYFWKKHTGAAYWLAFFFAMALGVSADLAGAAESWLYDQSIALAGTLILACPAPLIYRKMRKDDNDFKQLSMMYEAGNTGKPSRSQSQQTGPRNGKVPSPAPSTRKIPAPVILPKSEKRRASIIKKFNTLYALNLTDAEIDRIVAASFINEVWAREIHAMNCRYQNPIEWYQGDTQWLRIYIKVFTIQNITSDIGVQKDIALNSLNDLFCYADQHSYGSILECIDDINRMYFTNFDDMTFMLAYRLLEAAGKSHQLPQAQLLKSDRLQAEELTQKYL